MKRVKDPLFIFGRNETQYSNRTSTSIICSIKVSKQDFKQLWCEGQNDHTNTHQQYSF